MKKILYITFIFLNLTSTLCAEQFFMICSNENDNFDLSVDTTIPWLSTEAGILGCIGEKVRMNCQKTDTEISCWCQGGIVWSPSMQTLSRISGVFKVDKFGEGGDRKGDRTHTYYCRKGKQLF